MGNGLRFNFSTATALLARYRVILANTPARSAGGNIDFNSVKAKSESETCASRAGLPILLWQLSCPGFAALAPRSGIKNEPGNRLPTHRFPQFTKISSSQQSQSNQIIPPIGRWCIHFYALRVNTPGAIVSAISLRCSAETRECKRVISS